MPPFVEYEHFLGFKNMKTFSAKPETVKRDWYVVDADGKTLGRLATEIARRLRGNEAQRGPKEHHALDTHVNNA